MTQERKNGTRARRKSPIGTHTQLPRKHTPDYTRTRPRRLNCQAETKDLWQSTLRAGAGGLHIGYILAKLAENPGSTN
jgi:hypothetical protein